MVDAETRIGTDISGAPTARKMLELLTKVRNPIVAWVHSQRKSKSRGIYPSHSVVGV